MFDYKYGIYMSLHCEIFCCTACDVYYLVYSSFSLFGIEENLCDSSVSN